MLPRWLAFFLLMPLAGQVVGRAEAAPSAPTPFRFAADTFSYTNRLTWFYRFDAAAGRTVPEPLIPTPAYRLRCVVMSRTARQFFESARFEPNEPKATSAVYRNLVRMVLGRNPRRPTAASNKLVIPGFADLREFSSEYEHVLKAEAGEAWHSFVQRGNWRMVFPFSRRHQARTAARLVDEIRSNRPPLVHLVCFPSCTLNHVVLLYQSAETSEGLEFLAYDPNRADQPVPLRYCRATRSFVFPATHYFAGGPVDVYEIYRGLLY